MLISIMTMLIYIVTEVSIIMFNMPQIFTFLFSGSVGRCVHIFFSEVRRAV